MTKVRLLTVGGFTGEKFTNAIGGVFDAQIIGGEARVDLNDDFGYYWLYFIGTECEIVENDFDNGAAEYATLAATHGILIIADGVTFDGRADH